MYNGGVRGGKRWAWNVLTRIRSLIEDKETIGLNEAIRFVQSGVKETFVLTLDDGTNLRATADHEILTVRGYVPLGDLVVGADQVICDRTVKNGQVGRKPRYVLVNGLKHHPYCDTVKSKAYKGKECNRVPMHRLVVEASLSGVSLEEFVKRCKNGDTSHLTFIDPGVYAVHHKDFNEINNDADNLEVITHSEHWRLHGKLKNFKNFGYGIPLPVQVKSIEKFGREMTYDVVCANPNRNFVANGMVIHNCGKTTIVSQFSMEWAKIHAVPTLWGSFEIENTKLVDKMFYQFTNRPLFDLQDDFQRSFNEFAELPIRFMDYYDNVEVSEILDAMDYAVSVYDVQHIILDNMQFMMGTKHRREDKFDWQDKLIENLRHFSRARHVHISLIVHPRKQDETKHLTAMNLYGSVKAPQEADNILILQNFDGAKCLTIEKNRELGALCDEGKPKKIYYSFDQDTKRIREFTEDEMRAHWDKKNAGRKKNATTAPTTTKAPQATEQVVTPANVVPFGNRPRYDPDGVPF